MVRRWAIPARKRPGRRSRNCWAIERLCAGGGDGAQSDAIATATSAFEYIAAPTVTTALTSGGARDGTNKGLAAGGESVEEHTLVREDRQLVTSDHIEGEELGIEERRRAGTGHHGRRVDSIGFRLHLATPAFYVESVDALHMTRRQRIVQAAAGPWAEWLVTSVAEAREVIDEIGFPAILRPSFTLGGSGGGIAYNLEDLEEILDRGLDLSGTRPDSAGRAAA